MKVKDITLFKINRSRSVSDRLIYNCNNITLKVYFSYWVRMESYIKKNIRKFRSIYYSLGLINDEYNIIKSKVSKLINKQNDEDYNRHIVISYSYFIGRKKHIYQRFVNLDKFIVLLRKSNLNLVTFSFNYEEDRNITSCCLIYDNIPNRFVINLMVKGFHKKFDIDKLNNDAKIILNNYLQNYDPFTFIDTLNYNKVELLMWKDRYSISSRIATKIQSSNYVLMFYQKKM